MKDETLTYRLLDQNGNFSDKIVFNIAYDNYKYQYADINTRYELLLKKIAEYEGI